MDDKELIRRVRNSFRAKKSHAQVLKGFQKKGYKLEYAEKLISKALLPKKIIGFLILSLILFFSGSIASYTLFSDNEKASLENPLSGLSLGENFIWIDSKGLNFSSQEYIEQIESIEVTPEFINYLLNEIGAWELHQHPLTFGKPIIVTRIGNDFFSSVIGDEIITVSELFENADIEIELSKEILIEVLIIEDPEESVRNYLMNGEIVVTPIAGETTLLAKGYLNLYDSLK